MRKGLQYCFAIILFAVIAAIWADLETKQRLQEETITTNTKGNLSKEITEVPFNQNGIEAVYPKFLAGGTEDDIEQWNQIIDKDVQGILHIYSFPPIPEPTPSPESSIPTILKLGYDIKVNSDQLISILYTASFRSPYSAHPTDLVYSTNINKITNKRVSLKDYVILNQEFVKFFRTWDFITYEDENEELNQAIRDYFTNMTDMELLLGFQTADQIGSTNLYHIYSYHTPDKLGISIEVPNYLGDHVEFEQEKSKLEDYLRKEESTS